MNRPSAPVVLFAFANNRLDAARYLRNLPQEQRRVRMAMTAAEQSGLCEIVERANATATEVLDVPANRSPLCGIRMGSRPSPSARTAPGW